MSEKHKIAIRESVLTRMYGPEWRKVLTERRAAKSIEHILQSEKIIKHSKRLIQKRNMERLICTTVLLI